MSDQENFPIEESRRLRNRVIPVLPSNITVGGLANSVFLSDPCSSDGRCENPIEPKSDSICIPIPIPTVSREPADDSVSYPHFSVPPFYSNSSQGLARHDELLDVEYVCGLSGAPKVKQVLGPLEAGSVLHKPSIVPRQSDTHFDPTVIRGTDVSEEDEIALLEKEVKLRRLKLEAQKRSSDVNRLTTNHVGVPHARVPPSNTLESCMERLTLCSNLPKIEVPRFSGLATEYHMFMRSFEMNIGSRLFDDGQRLSYLLYYCEGNARAAIQHCVLLPSNQGYHEACRILQQQFGRPHEVIQAVTKELLNGPRLISGDVNGLRILVNQMRGAYLTLSQLGRPGDVDCSLYLTTIVGRLPSHMQERWADVAEGVISSGREPSFLDLLTFVERRVSVASNLYGQLASNSAQQQYRHEHLNSHVIHRQARSAAILQQSVCRPCVSCGDKHDIHECPTFLSKTAYERFEVAKAHKLCFVCLKANHTVRACKTRAICATAGCNRRHHRLLHVEQQAFLNVGTTCGSSVMRERVVLGCVPVSVVGSNGTVDTYALIDNGSDTTLITHELATAAGLSVNPCRLKMRTVNGCNSVGSGQTSFRLRSLHDGTELDVDLAYVISQLPVCDASAHSTLDLTVWPHLKDVSRINLTDKRVGLLIGCDLPEVHKVLDQRMGVGKQPYAVRSVLGWTIRGPWHGKAAELKCFNIKSEEEESLVDILAKFFELEFQDPKGAECKAPSEEDDRALKIVETSAGLYDGKYTVGLPWRDAFTLPCNYAMAKQRLYSLRKRLAKDRNLYLLYADVIQDHLTKGYISLAKSQEQARRWFLPHHPVVNPNKPGKVRIVFDCAARYLDRSLNRDLLSGPDWTNDLTGVLLRFRKYPVAVCADVQEMFLQVGVPDNDRRALSFLWWDNDEMRGEPCIFHLNVHPFGATSSPFCATYALRRTARDNTLGLSGECRDAVVNNFYVDDCLVSVANSEAATVMVHELREMLKCGGFRLTKWNSNCVEALRDVPVVDRSSTPTELGWSSPSVQSVLGLRWDVTSDRFKVVLDLPVKAATRRGILATVASLYDPLGFTSPMSLPARQLLQELCKLKLGWDDILNDQYVARWNRWLLDIGSVTSITVPRHIGLSETNIDKLEIHVFCDASDNGYGAVSYLRVVTKDNVSCSFLMGKSRVSPRKIATIPRMELVAAVLAVKLSKHVTHELQIPTPVFLWTDSSIVLYYLKNTTSRFATFVANRIKYIKEHSEGWTWRHVPSELNPADVASRGARVSESPEMRMWLSGPEFLQHAANTWPPNCCPIPPVVKEGIEIKSAAAVTIEPAWHAEWFSRYSSWIKLLRSVAWLTRFKNYCLVLNSKRTQGALQLGTLSAGELTAAKLSVIRLVQVERFNSQLSSGSLKPLQRLCPIKIQGILCVGGRLQGSDHAGKAHPMILPARHPVTDLIIRFFHESNGHSGAVHVLANIRQTFWIMKGMAQVRRVVRNCSRCKLLYAAPLEQIMAPLPPERVRIGTRPFRFCGIDYFGPFKVRCGRSDNKRYGCLFTCLQTRAVHIEISYSLTTDSFMMCLMRFMNRWSTPETIYSDNGTNFVGAEKELKGHLLALDQSKISGQLVNHGVDWRFNPAGASHRGGVWERIIRSVRRVLSAVLVEQSMSDEVLLTSMTEVERILNARPLIPVYDDPEIPGVLRPVDLLLPWIQTTALDTDMTLTERYKKSWRQAQHVASTFWKRWMQEYLPTLQERVKWFKPTRNIKKGDLVLIVDATFPRGLWKRGLVVNVSEGIDGHPRKAEVKTSDGLVRKDIRSLCLLEGDDSIGDRG